MLLARRSGLHVARIDHLLGRYGGLVDDLLALVAERPELGAPLDGAEDYLAAEVVYAVTHEGARHLDDVLTRRTRISIETFDRGVAAAPAVARLMAAELGWDDARTADEVDHYLRRVEAERQSPAARAPTRRPTRPGSRPGAAAGRRGTLARAASTTDGGRSTSAAAARSRRATTPSSQ